MTPRMKILQKYIDDLLNTFDKNTKTMNELLEDEKVQLYADCAYENNKIANLLEDAKEELEFEKMRNCKHSFVKKKVSPNSDLTYNYCPNCGVNNREKVINPSMEGITYHDKMVVSIYKETAKNGVFPVNIYEQNKKSSK